MAETENVNKPEVTIMKKSGSSPTVRRLTGIVTALAWVIISVRPGFAGVGEATAIFLQIPPGARAAGMGEAFVAVADDGTATWWNPAGMAFLSKDELSLMHVNWLPTFHLPDLYVDFISYVQPVKDWGVVGGHVQFLNLGETERRDELNQYLGKFATFETAISTSYGTKITENTGLGVSVKFIYSHLADKGTGQEQGSGVGTDIAVDIGILHKTIDPLFGNKLQLGANLSNLGPKMSYIDVAQADPIPTGLAMGFAYSLLDDSYNKLVLTGETDKLLVRKYPDGKTDPFYIALFTAWTDEPFFYDLIYHAGMEYWYSDMVGLRMGYWNDEIGKVKPVTYGASFKVSAYRFDISYLTAEKGHPLTGTTHFSITIDF